MKPKVHKHSNQTSHKNVCKKLITLLLFAACLSGKAQVPADSLKGVYAGKGYYANPYTNPWVITNDTMRVTYIDSTNCQLCMIDAFASWCYSTYYSSYFSCNNSVPSNFYTLFYSGDSIKVIDDNQPQPPPSSPRSYRFYGKRIGPYTVGIKQYAASSMQFSVYPNPASFLIQVSGSKYPVAGIKLINILGEEVRYETLDIRLDGATLNVSAVPNGLYYIQVNNSKQKIIIQH